MTPERTGETARADGIVEVLDHPKVTLHP